MSEFPEKFDLPSPLLREDGQFEISPIMRILVEEQFGTVSERQSTVHALEITCRMSREMAEIVHAMHFKAGLGRFFAHTGNFGHDMETGQTYGHDFDTMQKLSDRPKEAQVMQMIKDASHLIVTLLHILAQSRYYFLIRDDDEFKKHNVFIEILRGYFGTTVPEAKLQKVAGRITDEALVLLRQYGQNPDGGHHIRWFEFTTRPFQYHTILEMFRMFETSEFRDEFPLPFNEDELMANLHRVDDKVEAMKRSEGERIMRSLPPELRELLRMV